MSDSDIKPRPGRKAIHAENLRPDGMTEEQSKILKKIAKGRDVSYAALKRMILRDYLLAAGYSDTDQGLVLKEWEQHV